MAELIRGLSDNGGIVFCGIDSTDIVCKAEQLHKTSATCSAALGRLLTGASLMGAMLKDSRDSITLRVNGGGPAGLVIACTDGTGNVKGCIDHPLVELPPRADGHLDVGGAVGKDGVLTVIRDNKLQKEPTVGQVPLVSGEIAEDFANYYVVSEQTPTLQSLGVLVSGEVVLSAGGVLLQPMPGCTDEIISQLELRSPLMADVSRELCHEPMEALMTKWFDGLRPAVLARTPLCYRCNCSRSRMEKALIAMGREELGRMIQDEQDGAELTCHFCKKTERFTQQDLLRLLNQAQA